MAHEIKVPTLGESVTEATVGEWLKKPGDPVKQDEPIASLETDKVAVEVPSPVAGVMGEYKVAVGDTVEVGAVLATIADATGAGEATPVEKREETPPAAEQAKPDAEAAPAPASTAPKDAPLAMSPCRLRCAARCLSTASIPPRSRAAARTAG